MNGRLSLIVLRQRHILRGLLRGDRPPLSEETTSQTISLARLTLVVGLVFLHYQQFPNSDYWPFDGMDPTRNQFPTFVNSFVLFFFFSAVPLLSTISGWLFFGFAAQDASFALRDRIRRRFKTLYLPLVVWNAAFLAVLLVAYSQYPQSPVLRELRIDLGDAGWGDYLDAVFAVTNYPIGYQFWFIRDLFVTVLVSPAIWWLLRRVPLLALMLLGAAFLSGSGLLIFFRPDVVFFFSLGGFLRLRRSPLQIGTHATWSLMALYLALVILRTMAPVAVEMEHPRPEWLTVGTRLMRLVGVLACWGVLQRFSVTRPGAWLARYGGLSFFLYAAHFPLIAGVKAALWGWLPARTEGWLLAHYFASVLLTIGIAVVAALLLVRFAPGAFAFMNGGRRALVDFRPLPAVPGGNAMVTPESPDGADRVEALDSGPYSRVQTSRTPGSRGSQ